MKTQLLELAILTGVRVQKLYFCAHLFLPADSNVYVV